MRRIHLKVISEHESFFLVLNGWCILAVCWCCCVLMLMLIRALASVCCASLTYHMSSQDAWLCGDCCEEIGWWLLKSKGLEFETFFVKLAFTVKVGMVTYSWSFSNLIYSYLPYRRFLWSCPDWLRSILMGKLLPFFLGRGGCFVQV